MRFSGQYIYMYSISFTCTIYYTSNPPNPCPQGPTQGFRKCGAFFPCCGSPWTEIKTSCHLRNFANLSPLCVILLTTCKCTGASHFHNLSHQLSETQTIFINDLFTFISFFVLFCILINHIFECIFHTMCAIVF